jgi:hypothetical protein
VDGGLHGGRRRRSFETNRFDRMANDAGAPHPCASAVGRVVAVRWVAGSIRPTSCPRDDAQSLGRPPGHDRFPPPRTHQHTPSRAAADRRERQSIGAFLPQRDQQVITIAD